MIRLNDEGNYCWDPEDREVVYEALASLCEELADEGYTDEELAAHTNAMLERMRLRQLH